MYLRPKVMQQTVLRKSKNGTQCSARSVPQTQGMVFVRAKALFPFRTPVITILSSLGQRIVAALILGKADLLGQDKFTNHRNLAYEVRSNESTSVPGAL